MKQYLDLLRDIYKNGQIRDDRTGTGTISKFGTRLEIDLRDGFPLLTTKKMYTKGILYELKWILNGDTNVKYLQDHNVHIWDEWAKEDGSLGPVYGSQLRTWGGRGIDQLKNVIEEIKKNPQSRRLVVTYFNPGDLPEMMLPPCHMFFQFYASGPWLDIQVYQRSADMFLGVPFDIAEYALLLELVARCTGLNARKMTYVFGDTHIYLNHLEQVKLQLEREPLKLPKLVIFNNIDDIDDYDPSQVVFEDYQSHQPIKAPVSV